MTADPAVIAWRHALTDHHDLKGHTMTDIISAANLTTREREAIHLMRTIVAEKGADYVYPDEEKDEANQLGNCQYLTYETKNVLDADGTVRYREKRPTGPSCIVGHYALAVGVPASVLESVEGMNPTVECLFGETVLGEALSMAQAAQDRGAPWGEALAEFEETLTNEVEYRTLQGLTSDEEAGR